jgi:signal transduction histidine kinase
VQDTALEPSVRPVWGDAFRLQQVVWNLVSNVIKFTPEGGRIEIRLDSQDSGAVIIVSDNGQGIKPELLPYLFERFVRAIPSATAHMPGWESAWLSSSI